MTCTLRERAVQQRPCCLPVPGGLWPPSANRVMHPASLYSAHRFVNRSESPAKRDSIWELGPNFMTKVILLCLVTAVTHLAACPQR